MESSQSGLDNPCSFSLELGVELREIGMEELFGYGTMLVGSGNGVMVNFGVEGVRLFDFGCHLVSPHLTLVSLATFVVRLVLVLLIP